MPVCNYPILEIIIRQLKQAGVHEIILAVSYMSHLFQAFFQDGSRYGLNIHYSFEEKALGTAGPIALVMDRLEDDFIVMNGDLLTTLSYRRLYGFHRERGGAATLGLFPREVKIDFGVIQKDADQQLQSYVEKPVYHFTVSMGINVFRKSAVREIVEPGVHADIPDLILKMKAAGFPVYCYSEACQWLDIGRMDDYQQAVEMFESRPEEFLQGE
jgi:NDP-sugar pyrophosphorylase family protein